MERNKKLATSKNPDFIVAHPEICREIEKGTTDIELKKYCEKILKSKLKLGQTPKPLLKNERFNRLV